MKAAVFVLAACLVPAGLLAAEQSWSGFYDGATLRAWANRVNPGIEQTLREDLLPRVPPESRRALKGVALSFPLEDPNAPFGFYSSWNERRILLSTSSMRLFRDLCVAYAWLHHNGYSTETVSDYLAMLRSQWPSERLRVRQHTPLEALGVPANAMDNPRVELLATALFSSGMTFILGHELGHIAFRHPGYDAVPPDQARRNEAQADDFALELMKQLGVAPIGVVIFFTAAAHWELEGLATQGALAKRTHPLNTTRINHVGQWMLDSADALSRSAEDPVKARVEVLKIAPEFSKITDALASPGANVLLRLRGLTATLDGLKPRRDGDPLIAVRAISKPPRQWDGVFSGNWISAAGVNVATALQITPTPQGIRGFYVFGAGRVRLEGEADGNEMRYRWTLDDANRGTGVLRITADGKYLTGTWTREGDGYTASWKLRWAGAPVGKDDHIAVGASRTPRKQSSAPGGSGKTGFLGVVAADSPELTPGSTSRTLPTADITSGAQSRESLRIAQEMKGLSEEQKRLSLQLDEMDKAAHKAIEHIRADSGSPHAEEGSASRRSVQVDTARNLAQNGSTPLVGHWRTTRLGFSTVTDVHIILGADGSAETWSVTASDRSDRVQGRWSTQDRNLNLAFDDGSESSLPYTFHEGQLVLPNIQGRRQFWDRVE